MLRAHSSARGGACPAPVRLVEPGAVPRFADPNRRAKLASAFPEIEALVEKERATAGAPAMALGVVVDGELAFVTGKGARDLEKGGAVNGRTVFRIGSITKIAEPLRALLNTPGWTGDDCKRTANDRLPCARLASGFAGQGLAGARCEFERAVRGDGKRTSTLWLRCNGDHPRDAALALEISESRVTDARVRAKEATARCDP